VLDRKFIVAAPNQAWVGDLTYIATEEDCERYANNILWISAFDMILMSWDVTEKKTYRAGGMLYRSKYPAARA
jgi:hypothetical protein